MIKEWIDELRGILYASKTHETIGDDTYSIEQTEHGPQLKNKIIPPESPTLTVETLTGFRDAVAGKFCNGGGMIAVHVVDFNHVRAVSVVADAYGRRQVWIEAKCKEVNPFPFGKYQNPEDFIISMNTCFLMNELGERLLRVASSLSAENSVATGDDGISQNVTVKTGAVTRTTVELPRTLKLIPWRTFRESAPVESDFLLRMKGAPMTLPTIALLEADGGKWRLDTIASVAKWLREAMPADIIIA